MLSAGMADTVTFTMSFPEQRVAHTSVKMFRLCIAPPPPSIHVDQ